jgi:hypothetical protein
MAAFRLGALAAALLALPAGAFAQVYAGPAYDSYEQQYGPPVPVRLEELINNPGLYYNRSIKTEGRLDFASNTSSGVSTNRYSLRDGYGNSVRLVPMPNVAGEFEEHARQWLGHDIEVTGLVTQESLRSSAVMQGELVIIQFWGFVGPDDQGDSGKPVEGRASTLEALVTRPGSQDGRTVRVVGKFRGRNLFGDLPLSSQRNTSDWVIKDDVFAVWVSGKKPKGSGWELDPTLKRDTEKWIEVIGKPETRRGVTYVRALRINLTTPPTPVADAKPMPPPPPRPKKPPVIVFALPLDGEADVPTNSIFVVQFNKDMDMKTFDGKVQLRYAGPKLPGDRDFDGLRLTYDEGRRALMVDPGDVLRSGRRLELILLPGISDIDGLALVPRSPDNASGYAVDVLHYDVGL